VGLLGWDARGVVERRERDACKKQLPSQSLVLSQRELVVLFPCSPGMNTHMCVCAVQMVGD